MVGVGTGGTISGVGRYLKERNPAIKVWGIDTYGSVFKKYKETGIFDKNEIYPYITEGIGEDFLPKNVDFAVIDHFEKVTDKDAAIMTRRIAREEGIFAGNSAGSAMAGLLQLRDHFTDDDVIVVIFHDHGSRYLGKMFNDEWMREKGFLEKTGMTARDLVAMRLSGELCSIESNEPVEHARPADERARLLADLDHPRQAARRVAQRDAPLRRARAQSRRQGAAGRIDHAAGVSVRRRVDAGGPAVDDDHAAESGGAGARLQDRQDVHHHAVGCDPGAVSEREDTTFSRRERGVAETLRHCLLRALSGLRAVEGVVMADEKALRAQLAKFLDWEEAHVGFDTAVKGIPPRLRGIVPDGWEYSAWQLVEHLRIAQADILEFCVNPKYKAKKWPDDYWPKSPAPPSGAAWTRSIAEFRRDRKAFQRLAADTKIDLARRDPARHGPDVSARNPAGRRPHLVSRRTDRRASPPARDLDVIWT